MAVVMEDHAEVVAERVAHAKSSSLIPKLYLFFFPPVVFFFELLFLEAELFPVDPAGIFNV